MKDENFWRNKPPLVGKSKTKPMDTLSMLDAGKSRLIIISVTGRQNQVTLSSGCHTKTTCLFKNGGNSHYPKFKFKSIFKFFSAILKANDVIRAGIRVAQDKTPQLLLKMRVAKSLESQVII